MTGRLIALNKAFPQTPQTHEYRPIVVLSPIVKFLEGYIVKQLQYWCKTNLKKQYGFVGGLNIENCKEDVIKGLTEKKLKKEECWVLYIDMKAAYDRVDLIKLCKKIED